MDNFMTNGFTELSEIEINEIDGGKWYNGVLTAMGGVASTLGACTLIGGAGVGTLGVGFLAAVGPVGWACLGVGAIGAAATGFATVDAWKS
ncbi:MAG: hypothetical protein MJ100_04925 [Ruminococcus sp.]|nr:hypothetical protein [Ruminococcus sp.]